jgi:hypothetical protein
MNAHLDALQLMLSNERIRYASDKSPMRLVWIAQIEKEIALEHEIAGTTNNMTDDELLSELLS